APGGQEGPVGAEGDRGGRAVVPLDREDLVTPSNGPDPCRPVPAPGGDARAVGAERHRIDRPGVPPERADQVAAPGVPAQSGGVPSPAPVASTAPSGPKATEVTGPE